MINAKIVLVAQRQSAPCNITLLAYLHVHYPNESVGLIQDLYELVLVHSAGKE